MLELYKNVEKLRSELKNDKNALKLYNTLKEINKNDQMYGWIFEDDAILSDTLDDLDLYQENYIIEILKTYKNDLEYIIRRAAK